MFALKFIVNFQKKEKKTTKECVRYIIKKEKIENSKTEWNLVVKMLKEILEQHFNRGVVRKWLER